MEAANLQIYWHESQPVYSLAMDGRVVGGNRRRLATGGGDNQVRLWDVVVGGEGGGKVESIEFVCALQQHEQAVNVVRFHEGTLASAGDDGQVLLWREAEGAKVAEAGGKEEWVLWRRLRPGAVGGSGGSAAAGADVYDLCWSPDGRYVATAAMDNVVRVFDVGAGREVARAAEHQHYVQGVAWDPLGRYLVSQSADRSVCVFEIERSLGSELGAETTVGAEPECGAARGAVTGLTLLHRSARSAAVQSTALYHNEQLPSFFRRLAFSPDGSLLCAPAGVYRDPTTPADLENAVYIYTRGSLPTTATPALRLPGLSRPAVAIAFNPNSYPQTPTTTVSTPYRMVYAVATANQVLIYDTSSPRPLAVIGNLHYTPLTDLAWSPDGRLLMVSSTDGFLSYISTGPHLGPPLAAVAPPVRLGAEPTASAPSVPVNVLTPRRAPK